MKKCKIIVYAISKNEEMFVNRWVDSVKEADEIYVLDTGSSDKTVKLLKKRGVKVKQKVINPWRFDVARNESLKIICRDADICVCIDLDEVLEVGWRGKLESKFVDGKNVRYRYVYNWKLDENNKPLVSFMEDKIHSLNDYYWSHPVHEVLSTTGVETYVDTDLVINHYPDEGKSRSSYLPLLKLSVLEDPLDDRNLHYLGREYMFYQMYDESIDASHKHLDCPNATWRDERCASMRFMARCYLKKNFIPEALFWYQNAVNEAPYLREGYIELGSLYESLNRYDDAYDCLIKAYQIKEKSNSYINEEFAWNDTIYDLLSIACFYTKRYDDAVKYVNEAIKINPLNERYQDNLKIMSIALHE